MTECAGISVIPSDHNIRAGEVGEAIPGIVVQLADDGEIMLRGDSVFEGYYGNPEQTADSLDEGGLAHDRGCG